VSGTRDDGHIDLEVIDKLGPYWEVPKGKKIVLEFNGSIQPVGLSANKFKRTCGKLVRSDSFVNMSDEWGSVAADKR
jgi:hypothetical protein